MADSKSSHKPLGLSFKENSDENKSGRDGKKAKKHKRQQSDLSDVHVDNSVAGQEPQHSTSTTSKVSTVSETPEELVMPQPEPEDIKDGTKAKPKKKSRLRRLSFGRKKKTDTKRESVGSSVESETSSSLEAQAGAMNSEVDVKNDEETQAGTRNAVLETSGDLGLDEEKDSIVVEEKGPAAVENSPLSNASSLTVVSPLGSKTNSPLLRKETTESQETWDHAEEIEISEIGDEFYSLPDDDEVCPQIEIPPDTDIAEGIPRPSDLFNELKDIENSSENSIANTIYAILQHLKAVAFGGDRCSHVIEITSETYKLGVIALDQSFAKFEGLFNFLLNQAEETTRKIVMYFLASLIKKYPHCFKVCKVKRKKRKSALKPTETATQPAQKDTVS